MIILLICYISDKIDLFKEGMTGHTGVTVSTYIVTVNISSDELLTIYKLLVLENCRKVYSLLY